MPMTSRGMPASASADAMRYGVQNSCDPGFNTRPSCIAMTGSHNV